jgi:hypothetical protein
MEIFVSAPSTSQAASQPAKLEEHARRAESEFINLKTLIFRLYPDYALHGTPVAI